MRQRAPRRAAVRNDERINVGLPREVHAALVAEAQAENVTLSVIARRAIDYYQAHAPGAVPPAPKAVA